MRNNITVKGDHITDLAQNHKLPFLLLKQMNAIMAPKDLHLVV